MKAIFWTSNKERENLIAQAFCIGFRQHGHECEIKPTYVYQGPEKDSSLALIIGVKGLSKQLIQEHRRAGITTIYIDKGYVRLRSDNPGISLMHFRFSINSFQPLDYFQRVPKPADRWKTFGHVLKKPKRLNGSIIFAGSSQKYCNWHNLGDATTYAQKNIKRIRKIVHRPIIYRPKPNWREAIPIDGSIFSHGKRRLTTDLEEAYALVTFGSNAAFDAIVEGVPVVVLGDGIARPIANTQLEQLRAPYFPDEQKRWQWCCDLAYCQWSLEELKSGEAWHYLQEEIAAFDSISKVAIPHYR